MAERGKKLPPELEEFLKEVEENLSLYPETIVYNRIKDHVVDLSTKQIARLTSTVIVSAEFIVRIFKTRCDAGDKLACEMLDLAVNGDPYSKNETVRKGLIGLWQIDNDGEAGKLLLEIGRITQEDFNKERRTGKDLETINGKTRETLLCELAVEAKKYPTADAFSMAMIMRQLPGLDTTKVYKIIEGKYTSAEEFWFAVQKGEICTEVKKKVVVAPPEKEIPPAPPKEKEAPKPEAVTTPAQPLIPVPKEPGKEVPRLDLMKGEIEERIKKMKGEKARGELKAGEGKSTSFSHFSELIGNAVTEEELGEIEKSIEKSRELTDDEKGILKAIITETIESMVLNQMEKSGALKVMEKKISELSHDERIKLAKMIAATIEGKKPEEEVEYITIDELMKLPVEKRRELLKKIASGETEVTSSVIRENGKDEDELREPRDYTQWAFADFEGLINGLEDIEDLVELREFIDVSEKLTETDAEALRNMIKTRIDELTKGYAGMI